MTRLIRWNPAREMMDIRNEFDRLFNEALGVTRDRWTELGDWSLPLDLEEHDEHFIVTASIPGINPDDIDISLVDNMLTIKASINEDSENEGVRYHLRERRFGNFIRSVMLPVQVNADAVEASYDKGVLNLTIPKAEEIKPRRIAIKLGDNRRTILEGQTD